MEAIPTSLAGVLLLRPTVRSDHRGAVSFVWNATEWAALGLPVEFALENHITSRQWALRGIHRQVSVPQGKLVRCLAGSVFDVAVDLRPESPAFGRWTGSQLRAEAGDALWVPPGFGHGILALTEGALISIQATAPAVAGDERTLAWNDTEVGVNWPIPVGVSPVLSARDSAGDSLEEFLLHDAPALARDDDGGADAWSGHASRLRGD